MVCPALVKQACIQHLVSVTAAAIATLKGLQ